MWRSHYLKLGGFDHSVIERLKRVRHQPDLFESILLDASYQPVYSTYSRAAHEALEQAADYALFEFPNTATFHAIKAWAHFARTDLGDARTRYEGIRTAKSIFEHAILLNPDFSPALVGLASTSYWLGDHGAIEGLLAKSKLNVTGLPVVDVIRGNSAMFCGRTDEAIEILGGVLEKGAGLASLANWYATYALAHFSKGAFETALSACNAALEFSTEY